MGSLWVSTVTSKYDVNYCICLRIAVERDQMMDRLHGYGPQRNCPGDSVLMDPHDHPLSRAAVRGAKPYGEYLDFHAPTKRVGLARQRPVVVKTDPSQVWKTE